MVVSFKPERDPACVLWPKEADQDPRNWIVVVGVSSYSHHIHYYLRMFMLHYYRIKRETVYVVDRREKPEGRVRWMNCFRSCKIGFVKKI